MVMDFLWERGSVGSKGLSLRCGVIDAGYRGEIFFIFSNVSSKPVIFTKKPELYEKLPIAKKLTVVNLNKAIVQGVIMPSPNVSIEEIEDINDFNQSERGDGCLGSSNK